MNAHTAITRDDAMEMAKENTVLSPRFYTTDFDALDAIDEVGPGGEFLTHNHTLKFCRSERWPATIDGSATGLMINHRDMMQWLQEKKAEMLDAYRQPVLPDDVRLDMVKYLADAGFDAALPILN